jgi:hypothetical protein
MAEENIIVEMGRDYIYLCRTGPIMGSLLFNQIIALRVNMKQRYNNIVREKRARRQSYPVTTLSATHPTYNCLGTKTDFWKQNILLALFKASMS